jgi:alpha-maltose-1-phosphate synthase
MRVLIYGRFFDYEIQLSRELSKFCEPVLVMPSDSIPAELADTLNEKFEFHIVTNNKPNSLAHRIWSTLKVLAVINKKRPNIVHVQVGSTMECFLLMLYVKIVGRCSLITTFHDVKIHVGEESRLEDFLRFWLRKYSNKIFVHGHILRQQMLKDYKMPDRKVFTIPLGEHKVAPFLIFKRNDLEEDGNLILFFGRIHRYKGLDYLIQAEPLITGELPGTKIVIAGSGENFKVYENMIGDRKNNYIIQNKFISFKEGAEIFQRSSIVVLPYIDASQSGVVLTAYGFKKPVVVTDVGSISEIVDPDKTGLIVPPKDSASLARAVVKLMKDKNLREQMGENAYRKLKSDLSFELIARQTFEVYKNAR